ncbi:glucose-1-phosphate adenylyltransferase [Marinitoga hydrogenitolerans DSM 16785]|uniref:Glucose-1-phosphate adenylyltransferase n=1 Tax=Marinitoga hydrogenitolerans (strain DSM 16785 / JCM 12826 / AT1271) TaxID=1122195 RepID=A0A1M4W135_MARH1|nr:glucose-1-phosphate adenylyltransferase subunit GlgD [Marinitoga hydrogenitolerans]SHE74971.1 glucose-1-phosphate adenylyltransferase [Marinitoga hydrogenitolerans DSM 16785]
MKVLGLILAGASTSGVKELTKKRASAAVPVFGKYRAIDFTLSNFVNSKIKKVGVLTQYYPRSLMDHLGSGKEWDLDRKTGGLFILQPYFKSKDEIPVYKGTADAIFQNMTLLRRGDEDFVLIGSGDHIYNFDFTKLYHYHLSNAADITILTKEFENDELINTYGQVITNEEGKVIEFHEKPAEIKSRRISLGVYFINKALLIELLYTSIPGGGKDIVYDIIIPNLSKLRIFAYDFKGYWSNIKKSVETYYKTNMDILKDDVRRELFYSKKIYTKLKDYAPPKININANVHNAFVADGSIINGTVKNSIISRGVKVKAGAVVENSIILQDTVISEGSVIKNAIIDKDCKIREGHRVVGEEKILVIEKGTII